MTPSPYHRVNPGPCAKCPRRRSPILATGPSHCRVMLIGEGPSRDEDRLSRPFAGRTGKELDGQHCPIAGIDRDDIYVTNACKCPSPNYKNPKLPLVLECSNHWLHREIAAVRPEIIVPMGALACAAIGVDIRLNHATPVRTSFGNWSGTVFPTYHPSAGMRSADFLIKIQYAFRRLGQFLRGEITYPVDEYPTTYYAEITSRDDIDSIWQFHTPTATDTETIGHKILRMLSFSQEPGTGYVVRPGTPAYLAVREKFAAHLNEILMHNAPYDLEVYQRADFDIDDRAHRLHDTMVEAYHRMYLPQGLKALAWQLCGMRMQDFNDLVTPHSAAKLLEYLSSAHSSLYSECFHTISKRKRDPITRKLTPVTLLEANREMFPDWYFRLITKISKLLSSWPDFTGKSWLATTSTEDEELEAEGGGDDDDSDESNTYTDDSGGVDPWKRVSGWNVEDRELLECQFGKWPVRSIDDAPAAEAVRYSAADADATLRLFYKLRSLGRG